MEPKPLLRVGGPAWEIARTVLLLAYLAVASSAAGSADMLSAPWLAAVGAAGLVVPAAFVMYAAAPQRHAAFLPLLRLGKALEAASILLLFATGVVAKGATMPGPLFTVPLLGDPPWTFGLVFALDLLVLTGLLRVRGRP
jgi:hypothetical protein